MWDSSSDSRYAGLVSGLNGNVFQFVFLYKQNQELESREFVWEVIPGIWNRKQPGKEEMPILRCVTEVALQGTRVQFHL